MIYTHRGKSFPSESSSRIPSYDTDDDPQESRAVTRAAQTALAPIVVGFNARNLPSEIQRDPETFARYVINLIVKQADPTVPDSCDKCTVRPKCRNYKRPIMSLAGAVVDQYPELGSGQTTITLPRNNSLTIWCSQRRQP